MKHVRRLVLMSIMLGFPAAADGPNAKWPDCYCTDKNGVRVELGQSICLTVDGRSFTARCEMSLNNPMWREQKSGCLAS